MVRKLDELLERADSLADQFVDFDPAQEDFERPMPPLLALKLAAFRRDYAEKELAGEVSRARAEGISWRAIGERVGTSGEAARQRYAHVV